MCFKNILKFKNVQIFFKDLLCFLKRSNVFISHNWNECQHFVTFSVTFSDEYLKDSKDLSHAWN